MDKMTWLLAATCSALIASTASALPIDVLVMAMDNQGIERRESGVMDLTDPDGDGIYEFDASSLPANVRNAAGRWEITQFDGFFNVDPVVSNSFDVTNLLPVTQTFSITLSTATGPIGNPTTVVGGSAQGGVTDTNGDGGTLSTTGAGSAFFMSLIDGADFVPLYSDPFSASAGAFGSSSLLPLEDFGTPIPSQPGPAVANSIGIRFEFDITGNDRATGSGVFVVEPVPVPEASAGLLLAVGLIALARRSARD